MGKTDFDEINNIFLQFIKEVPIRFGEFLTASDDNFRKVVERLVDDFNLHKDSEQYKIDHGVIKEKEKSLYPWGSSVYYTKNRNFAVIANFEDHFTLLYRINGYSLKDALLEIEKILQVLQKFVRKFSYLNEFGFLTSNPLYSGSGMSISCRFKEISRGDNAMEIEKEEQHQSIGLNLILENDGHIRLLMHRLNPNKCDAYLEFLHLLIKRQKEEKQRKLIEGGQLLSYGEEDILSSYEGVITPNSLNCLDCFDEEDFGLMAPAVECYEAFGNLYSDFFKVKYTSSVPVQQLRGDLKAHLVFNKSKEKNFDKANLQIKFEIGRNVQGFNFNKFLRKAECLKLRQMIIDLLNILGEAHQVLEMEDLGSDSKGISVIAPIDFSPDDAANNTQIIVPAHKRYTIRLFKDDHIRFVSDVDDSNIENVMKHIFILMENFEKNKITFAFDEKLGFLSERALSLGFNMKMALNFRAKKAQEETIEESVRKYGYSVSHTQRGNSEEVFYEVKSKKVSDFYQDVEFLNFIFDNISTWL